MNSSSSSFFVGHPMAEKRRKKKRIHRERVCCGLSLSRVTDHLAKNQIRPRKGINNVLPVVVPRKRASDFRFEKRKKMDSDAVCTRIFIRLIRSKSTPYWVKCVKKFRDDEERLGCNMKGQVSIKTDHLKKIVVGFFSRPVKPDPSFCRWLFFPPFFLFKVNDSKII